jgi:hypothetical protein
MLLPLLLFYHKRLLLLSPAWGASTQAVVLVCSK